MKQKIVIRVSMNDEKSRSKALRTVVAVSGVESVALVGAEKNQLEVVGDVDAVVLTNALRKKVAPAELFSVGEAKKPEEKKAETPAPPSQVVWDWSYYPQNVYHYPIFL
ncbi:heavy metal-associated isoprenylated plant protein 16-like [Olea europaea var. sylvestris]|uniref:heavy metal-associated isoprenylated plant protein 16-like n=1 Tax=Olea europaea var. sylvestris TaxID=158386 RepID=UPI000C1CCDA7|nr:heavy metal-associated isoprenylated plant protein 16-like [Olea europaea var. sylvestris]